MSLSPLIVEERRRDLLRERSARKPRRRSKPRWRGVRWLRRTPRPLLLR